MVDAFLNKKYKLVSSENFDEYLKAIGQNVVTRKLFTSATPTIELKKEGDHYVIYTYSTLKNLETKFKPGVEFEDNGAKTIMTIEGNTIHAVRKEDSGKESTIDRIFSDDEVKVVMKIGDIVSTRVYKIES